MKLYGVVINHCLDRWYQPEHEKYLFEKKKDALKVAKEIQERMLVDVGIVTVNAVKVKADKKMAKLIRQNRG